MTLFPSITSGFVVISEPNEIFMKLCLMTTIRTRLKGQTLYMVRDSQNNQTVIFYIDICTRFYYFTNKLLLIYITNS